MAATNTYTPAGLTYRNAYNFARAGYVDADVPTVTGAPDPTTLKQQTAYEWFQSGTPVGGAGAPKSNPPFASKAAGVLMSGLVDAASGQPARILRGFIRRAEYSVADPVSQCRLNFMYNPEAINRDYVSYLDQGALDPFNTVFQSGNLVAPPSFMNFSFSLFFDRQDEAAYPDNPGVFVDYEYFDLVVRNVIPGDTTNSALPDNGVMMVNPRDITVVFSPQITVQGRPLNASVSFQKFTHRMVPTRMLINLTMRVVYFGPIREMTTFVQEEFVAQAKIPWGQTEPEKYNLKYTDLDLNVVDIEDLLGNTDSNSSTDDPAVVSLSEQTALQDKASTEANVRALNNAIAMSGAAGTQYDVGNRNDLWSYADCSSWVWGAWASVGLATKLHWPDWPIGVDPRTIGAPDTTSMWGKFNDGSSPSRKLWGWPGGKNSGGFADATKSMVPGDLLIRYRNPNYPNGGTSKQHIAIVSEVTSGRIKVWHASDPDGDVKETTYSPNSNFYYNYGVRPLPAGSGQANNANTPNNYFPVPD